MKHNCCRIKAGWKNFTKPTVHTVGKKDRQRMSPPYLSSPSWREVNISLLPKAEAPGAQAPSAPQHQGDVRGHAWAAIPPRILQLSLQFLKQISKLWSKHSNEDNYYYYYMHIYKYIYLYKTPRSPWGFFRLPQKENIFIVWAVIGSTWTRRTPLQH